MYVLFSLEIVFGLLLNLYITCDVTKTSHALSSNDRSALLHSILPTLSRHARCLRMMPTPFGASYGEDRQVPLKAGRNWEIAHLPESILGSRSDFCASINKIFLWKVTVLLTSANFSASFLSQVTKPTSIDPDEGFCDWFPCPILDFSDSSIFTRLNEPTSVGCLSCIH